MLLKEPTITSTSTLVMAPRISLSVTQPPTHLSPSLVQAGLHWVVHSRLQELQHLITLSAKQEQIPSRPVRAMCHLMAIRLLQEPIPLPSPADRRHLAVH